MEKRFLVCIYANWKNRDGIPPSEPTPVKGEIYTFDGQHSEQGIFLKEFTWLWENGKRCAWTSRSFRPIDNSFGIEKCESIERQPVTV